MHLNRVQRIYLFTFFVGFSVYCRSHFICDMHRCFCCISAHFFLSLSLLRFEYEMQMHSRHQRTDEHEIQCNRILAQETRAARCAAFIIGHFRLPINYNIDFILFFEFPFDFSLVCSVWIHAVMWHCQRCRLRSIRFRRPVEADHCVWCGHAHENCRFGRLPFSLLIISWLLKLVIHYHVVFSMPIGHQPNTTLQDIASLRWQRINVKEKDWKEKSTYTWMLSLLSFRQFITIRLLRIGINPDLYLHNYTVKFKFNSWNGLLIQRM